MKRSIFREQKTFQNVMVNSESKGAHYTLIKKLYFRVTDCILKRIMDKH